tara:strand:+ start:504 stop:1046 length:543 start_codon:yes stop_codon:yes gene_type:complete
MKNKKSNHIMLKHYTKDVMIPTWLYEGQSEIDYNYYINKIKENISDKHSYATNVSGKMTSWDCFVNDEKFLEFIKSIMPLLSHHTRSIQVRLKEAWGNMLNPGDHVRNHDHRNAEICGVLYLTEGEPIYFPQYNINIKPTPGKFLLFHSMISHSVPTNQSLQERYSLAFNFYNQFEIDSN